jgi:hypothetical protein
VPWPPPTGALDWRHFSGYDSVYDISYMVGAVGIISVAGVMYRDLYASDPGWVQPGSKMDVPTRPLCQYCMVRPPMRSRHCFLSGEGAEACAAVAPGHALAMHEGTEARAVADITHLCAFQGRAWSSLTTTVVSLHAIVGWQKLDSTSRVSSMTPPRRVLSNVRSLRDCSCMQICSARRLAI